MSHIKLCGDPQSTAQDVTVRLASYWMDLRTIAHRQRLRLVVIFLVILELNSWPRKRSPLARYTMYRRIYEKFSFRTRRRGQNGRILRHSRAMSGSAGLSPSRKRKPGGSTFSGYKRNLKKECAGLVAGRAVLIADRDHSPTPEPDASPGRGF